MFKASIKYLMSTQREPMVYRNKEKGMKRSIYLSDPIFHMVSFIENHDENEKISVEIKQTLYGNHESLLKNIININDYKNTPKNCKKSHYGGQVKMMLWLITFDVAVLWHLTLETIWRLGSLNPFQLYMRSTAPSFLFFLARWSA